MAVCVDFSPDVIKQAITDQLGKLPYYSAFAGTSNDPAIELSYELREFFKEDGTKVLYRSILLPVSDDGVTISGILGAVNCREVVDE